MKLLRIFKIDLELHWTFLLLLVLILLGGGLRSAAIALLLFTSVVLHELSHSLVAKLHGIKVRKILLLPIGGVSMIDEFAMPASTEFIVALSGPLVSFILAILGFLLELIPISQISFVGTVLKEANLLLGLFNLLPALPLDGGRVWRSWRQNSTPFLQATREAVRLSHIIVALLFIASLLVAYFLGAWGFLLWNVIIIFFVYSGSQSELEAALFKTASDGLRVRDVMRAEFTVASGEESLEEAHELAVQNKVRNLLLIDDGKHHKYHVVNIDSLAKIPKKQWPSTKIKQLAATPLSALPDMPLLALWKEMQERNIELAPVVEAGALIGVVSEGDIERLIHLKKIALITP